MIEKVPTWRNFPHVGAPPHFFPPLLSHHQRATIMKKPTWYLTSPPPCFLRVGYRQFFFVFGVWLKNFYVRNSRLSKQKSWISFDVSLESLLSLHFSKYWLASQRLGHPFLVFWHFFDSSKKIEKDVFCLKKVLKFLWIHPLYQRLSSLEEQNVKCFLNTFWATPLYLHCEPLIFMFPVQKGVLVLW